MGFLSDVGHKLGSWMGVSTDQVDSRRAALEELLRNGALKKAADLGVYDEGEGATIARELADQAKKPIGVDTTGMDAANPALAAAKAHYLDQFRNGGLEGQAAIASALQASGLMSQGGGQGVRDQILASAGRQGQVANIAQAERSAAGDQVNALDSNTAAQALQKAMFAAQVTHANLQANLERKNTLFGLQNTQDNLNNQAQGALNDATNAAESTGIDQRTYEAKIGNEILSMLTSAISKGGGTATSAFSTPAATPAMDYSAGYLPTSATVPGANLGSTGYLQQTAPATRIFPTAPSMPVQRTDWLGRK